MSFHNPGGRGALVFQSYPRRDKLNIQSSKPLVDPNHVSLGLFLGVPQIRFAACSPAAATHSGLVIWTYNSSRSPLQRREWLSNRTCVDAIGVHPTDSTELGDENVDSAIFYTDDLEIYPTPCAEYLSLSAADRVVPQGNFWICEGGPAPVPEVGISLYKSAVRNLAFAAYAAGYC